MRLALCPSNFIFYINFTTPIPVDTSKGLLFYPTAEYITIRKSDYVTTTCNHHPSKNGEEHDLERSMITLEHDDPMHASIRIKMFYYYRMPNALVPLQIERLQVVTKDLSLVCGGHKREITQT